MYLRPSQRPSWLAVDRTLGSLRLSDDLSGKVHYRQIMQKRVLELSENETPWNVDERWAKIRRGWCLGGDEFREEMVKLLDTVLDGKRRDSFAGTEVRKHDVMEARKLLEEGMELVGLCPEVLAELKKSDPRKMAVAWLIRRNTAVRNEWISEQLHMGRTSKMSYFVKQVEDARCGVLLDLKVKVKR